MPAVHARKRTTAPGRTASAHPQGRRVFRVGAGKPVSAGVVAARRAATAKLPSWRELANASGGKSGKKGQAFVESVTTRQFVLLILAIAAAFTLYIGHVQATQDLLSEVQQLRRENLRLHLKYNRLKGEFDYATSPSVIYERAKGLGLEEGHSYGATIKVQRDD